MASNQRELNTANLFRYALLALPLAFAGLPIYMLAPDFYAANLGLGLSALGAGLLILRLLDAVLDPLLGRALDLLVARALWIGVGACLLLCAGFLMLFVPPNVASHYLFGWFFVSVFLVTLAFSTLTILYGTVGALWSTNKSEQTRITTYREALTLVGLILSISIPFLLMEMLSARSAYLVLVLIFSALLILCFANYQGVQRAILGSATHAPVRTLDKNSVGDSDKEKTRDTAPELSDQQDRRSIWFLYLTYFISALASAVPAVLVVFFVRDYLGSQGFIGIALVIYFLSGALSMPIWQKLAARFGKVRAWQASMLLAILSFTWVTLLGPADFAAYALVCLVSGFALGAEMALPPAILAECLTGANRRSAALRYSGLTMISKLSLAIAAGVCLWLLGLVGFEPGGSNDSTALHRLVLLYGALPGVLKLLALGIAQVWIHTEKERMGYVQTTNFSTAGSMSDG